MAEVPRRKIIHGLYGCNNWTASWLGQRARHQRWATWLKQHGKILFNPPRTGSLGTRQLIQLAHWSDRPTIWTAEHRFKSQTVGWVQPERRPVDGFLKHCYTKAKNRSHGYFYFFLPGRGRGSLKGWISGPPPMVPWWPFLLCCSRLSTKHHNENITS